MKDKNSVGDCLERMGYTRTKARQLLKLGVVVANGIRMERFDQELQKGVDVEVQKNRGYSEAVKRLGIKVMYEDDDIMVVEKPAGMLTIASAKEKTMTLYYQLNEMMKKRNVRSRGRVFIVHRLDQDTSGLIVFAKNEEIKLRLQDRWKAVTKKYMAVAEGRMSSSEGIITSDLKEGKSMFVRSSPGAEGAKTSVTRYKVLQEIPKYSLLEVTLETGRKNQIRVHLSEQGNPVAGDKKYGARTNPFKRMALHSCYIALKHPRSGKSMRFESPGPFNTLFKDSRGNAAR